MEGAAIKGICLSPVFLIFFVPSTDISRLAFLWFSLRVWVSLYATSGMISTTFPRNLRLSRSLYSVIGRLVRRSFIIRRTCLLYGEVHPQHLHGSRNFKVLIDVPYDDLLVSSISIISPCSTFMVVTAVFILIYLFYYSGSRYDRLVGRFGLGHFQRGWDGMERRYGLSWLLEQVQLLLLSYEIDAELILTLKNRPRSAKAVSRDPTSVGVRNIFLTPSKDYKLTWWGREL